MQAKPIILSGVVMALFLTFLLQTFNGIWLGFIVGPFMWILVSGLTKPKGKN